jgi:hypothetical protein
MCINYIRISKKKSKIRNIITGQNREMENIRLADNQILIGSVQFGGRITTIPKDFSHAGEIV